MTTRFLDGPAVGVTLELERCPVFLRVVQDTVTGGWDALDQLDDIAGASEKIFVYRLSGDVLRGIACSRGPRCCRRFFHAEYVLHDLQPGQAELADQQFWSDFAHCEWDKLNPKPTGIA